MFYFIFGILPHAFSVNIYLLWFGEIFSSTLESQDISFICAAGNMNAQESKSNGKEN